MKVQLTVELDKVLMNRPFYWHYLEKTGGTPNPMMLTLVTGQQPAPDGKGEFIHFGSPRLHQIFASSKKLASFIRLYESVPQQGAQVPLIPWLCLNMKVTYQSDKKKDQVLSYGIQLVNGAIEEQFHSRLQRLLLTKRIPDFCYTLSPFIKPESAIKRIETTIQHQIDQEEHKWADEAVSRWKEDEDLLESFYEDVAQKPESYFVEKEALRTQYEPKILVEIINGGLFYLAK
jgi:hypothetical protein